MPNNSNTDFYGKKAFISKGFALLLGIAAIYMLLGVWIPIITKHKFESLFDFIFLFFFPVPCTLLAIYFFHTAGIIWGEISSRGIRKFSICLSLLLAALLLILISGIRKSISQSDEVFWAEVGTSVIMVTTGLFYLLVKRWIFMCFSVNEVIDYDAHRRATKLYFGFLGLSIWSDIVAITVFLPKGHNFEHITANLSLKWLIILGSITIAIYCYRIGLKLFLKKPQNANSGNVTPADFLDA